jgi:flagellar basal-body rod protein FlgG
MNDSMYIAATGMVAHQKSVDAIANNMANVNTQGYKKNRVNFEDLVYRGLAGMAGLPGTGAAPGVLSGSGVAIAALTKSFAQGELKKTDAMFDVAIQGDGFMEVTLADGGVEYTRGGTLTVNQDGLLATADGLSLRPAVRVGTDVRQLVVQADGTVMAQSDSQSSPVEVGRIELAHFADATGLTPAGANLYKATERSGDAIYGQPGEGPFGTLAQGYQEASNVNMVQEMVDLMVAQRAYESSVKVIQASDEMLAMGNNLRK